MSQARNVLRATALAVGATALVVVGVGLLLAKDWKVETTRVLRADATRVAALVRDLAAWPRWTSIQFDLGPQTAREVKGEAGSNAQRIVWTGNMGTVALAATAVGEASLDYTIRFEGRDAPLHTGRIEWCAEGADCRVRWIERGQFGDLLQRWFGWFGALQDRIEQVQCSSLAALQSELERVPAAK